MAQRNLRGAADAVERRPELAAALGVGEEESASWRDAAGAVCVPYDDELGSILRPDGFLRYERWNFKATPPESYPLLLHFPYFELYRKQVVKQADLVLAMHLCPDAFTDEQKARNFEYYEGITVRDSSLSACTQAVLAAEVGHLELAYDYLAEAALMDLDDLEHNTRDGLHIASLAGTWIGAVAGFGGMRDCGGVLSFKPHLPQPLSRLTFRLTFRGRRLRIDCRHKQAQYSLIEGEALEIVHHGAPATIAPGEPFHSRDPTGPEREPPTQPPGREPDKRRPLREHRAAR